MKKIHLLRYLFILSLIAIILQFTSTTYNLIKDPKTGLLEQAEKLREIKPDIAAGLEELAYEYETNKYFQIMPYVNLLFLILSLTAVIMMWQLKKQGWYLYLFAEFFPYVFSITSWDNYKKLYTGWSDGMLIAMTLTMVAFDILFAGLYFYALRESYKLSEIEENSAE